MAIQENEESSGWTWAPDVGTAVNPLSAIARPWQAWTNPIMSYVYGPWRAMAKGRGIMYPGIMPDRLGGNKFWNAFVGEGTGWKRNLGRAGYFNLYGARAGTTVFGEVAEHMQTPGMSYEQSVKAALRRKAEDIKYYRAGMGEFETDLVKVAKGERVLKSAHRKLARKLLSPGHRMAAIGMGIARVVDPIMTVAAVAEGAWLVGQAAYKGTRFIHETLSRAEVRMRNLELGGELTEGFLSGQAATERQRAVMAIQSSELSGRRFLGSEASMYAGY